MIIKIMSNVEMTGSFLKVQRGYLVFCEASIVYLVMIKY